MCKTALISLWVGVFFGLAGCKDDVVPKVALQTLAAKLVHVVPGGSVARGAKLIVKYQCNRCHRGEDLKVPAVNKDCVGCHVEIMTGRFKAPAESMARWKKKIVHLINVPRLDALGARLRYDWLVGFLRKPDDLRPRLGATMPRMPFDAKDARDVAAFLTRGAPSARKADTFSGADLLAGRELIVKKGCTNCHAFSGVTPPLSVAKLPVKIAPAQLARGMQLAPDLRFARQRFRRDQLVRWLREPQTLKPSTSMPTLPINAMEARNMAAYLWSVKLGPRRFKPIPKRLPLLARTVTFGEVSKRLFRSLCWHCHSEPDYAIGDGGPGNTGGFGFRPRGVNLAEYAGIASGHIAADGQRASLFAKTRGGDPLLLASMLARQVEEAGGQVEGVRGMPLGLPSMSPEIIQLVESWIAQGRPQ